MQATTIKIESPLLGELKRRMPKNKSISAYVRDILEKEIQSQKMIEAAREYTRFLADHREEEEWLEDWDKASLEQKPKTAHRKNKIAKS